MEEKFTACVAGGNVGELNRMIFGPGCVIQGPGLIYEVRNVVEGALVKSIAAGNVDMCVYVIKQAKVRGLFETGDVKVMRLVEEILKKNGSKFSPVLIELCPGIDWPQLSFTQLRKLFMNYVSTSLIREASRFVLETPEIIADHNFAEQYYDMLFGKHISSLGVVYAIYVAIDFYRCFPTIACAPLLRHIVALGSLPDAARQPLLQNLVSAAPEPWSVQEQEIIDIVAASEFAQWDLDFLAQKGVPLRGNVLSKSKGISVHNISRVLDAISPACNVTDFIPWERLIETRNAALLYAYLMHPRKPGTPYIFFRVLQSFADADLPSYCYYIKQLVETRGDMLSATAGIDAGVVAVLVTTLARKWGRTREEVPELVLQLARAVGLCGTGRCSVAAHEALDAVVGLCGDGTGGGAFPEVVEWIASQTCHDCLTDAQLEVLALWQPGAQSEKKPLQPGIREKLMASWTARVAQRALATAQQASESWQGLENQAAGVEALKKSVGIGTETHLDPTAP